MHISCYFFFCFHIHMYIWHTNYIYNANNERLFIEALRNERSAEKVDISVLFSSTRAPHKRGYTRLPCLSSIITLFFRNNKNFPSFARCQSEAEKKIVCEKEPLSTNRNRSAPNSKKNPHSLAHSFSGDLLRSLAIRSHCAPVHRARALRKCSIFAHNRSLSASSGWLGCYSALVLRARPCAHTTKI